MDKAEAWKKLVRRAPGEELQWETRSGMTETEDIIIAFVDASARTVIATVDQRELKWLPPAGEKVILSSSDETSTLYLVTGVTFRFESVDVTRREPEHGVIEFYKLLEGRSPSVRPATVEKELKTKLGFIYVEVESLAFL